MAWQTDMVGMLRVLVFDFDSTRYTDTRLEEVIVTAAQMVKGDAKNIFSSSYNIDYSTLNISPDPITNNDDNFVSLTLLRSACFIDNGEARTKARKAFVVKEFMTQVDVKGSADYMLKLWEKGYCKEYNDKLFVLHVQQASVGQIIMGPIRDFYGYVNSHRELWRS